MVSVRGAKPGILVLLIMALLTRQIPKTRRKTPNQRRMILATTIPGPVVPSPRKRPPPTAQISILTISTPRSLPLISTATLVNRKLPTMPGDLQHRVKRIRRKRTSLNQRKTLHGELGGPRARRKPASMEKTLKSHHHHPPHQSLPVPMITLSTGASAKKTRRRKKASSVKSQKWTTS